MRILRGAGATGLAVLPARDGRLIRPLIRARRADVLLHLERHAIAFARDPSNEDRHFLRSRVRHDILPLLAELDPNVAVHLCAIADDVAAFGADERGKGGAAYRLSRATRAALARLERDGRGEVLLPGGIVASKKRIRKEA